MKLYFVAGERSGDLHGSNLIRAVRMQRPHYAFRGFGGDAMQQAGMELVVHYRELAFMGFGEVIRHLGKIRSNLRICQTDILTFRPDAVVLIDFAGFNLRIARFAKKHGIPVFWYIAPKVWAWNSRRVLRLKACVDHLFTILPFEPAFFARYGWEVAYVGNPVRDAISSFRFNGAFRLQHNLPEAYVAILPGSRRQEVRHMAPVLVQVAGRCPDLTFVVPKVNNLNEKDYRLFTTRQNIRVLSEPAYDILYHARAAVVTSGTATLETALLNVPQVVVYKTGWLSYALGRLLIKVPFISLVNLIAGRKVVQELIQHAANAQNIARELKRLLEDTDYRKAITQGYWAVRQQLGEQLASEEAARRIIVYLEREKAD